jgi:signal transduction histidine kinase
VVISVGDERPGVPAGERDRLFQSFAKTSVKSTAGEKGTGLGLAIVRRIVLGHGGEIWFGSELGEGTTFYVSLPAHQEEAGM